MYVNEGWILEFTGPYGWSNVMSGVIGNLVIASNYRVEYLSCEGYITEITISGLMECWITAWVIDNIKELMEHCSKSFATKYRRCGIYRQLRGPSGHLPTNCITNAGLFLSRNSIVVLLAVRVWVPFLRNKVWRNATVKVDQPWQVRASFSSWKKCNAIPRLRFIAVACIWLDRQKTSCQAVTNAIYLLVKEHD